VGFPFIAPIANRTLEGSWEEIVSNIERTTDSNWKLALAWTIVSISLALGDL
jgi:hypothetical protein